MKMSLATFSAKKTIQTKWFFSYLLVLILPLIIMITSCITSYHQIKNELDYNTSYLVNRIQERIDLRFSNADAILSKFNFNPIIDTLSSTNSYFATGKIANIRTLQNELLGINTSNEAIAQTYIYFESDDYILTQSDYCKIDLVPYKTTAKHGLSALDWNYILEQASYKHALIQKSSSSSALFLAKMVYSPNRNAKVYMVAVLDTEYILSLLQDGLPTQAATVTLLVQETNSLMSTNNEFSDHYNFADNDGSFFEQRVSSSFYDDLSFSYLVPAEEYYLTINKYLRTTLLTVLWCIASSLILLRFVSRINYKPLSKIMSSLPQTEKSAKADEFSTIYSALSKMDKQLYLQNSTLNRNWLTFLLLHKADSSMIESSWDFDGDISEYAFFCLVVSIQDYGIFSATPTTIPKQQTEIRMAHLVIENVLSELVSPYFHSHFTTMEHNTVCVVHYKTNQLENPLAVLEANYKTLCSFIQLHYEITLQCCISPMIPRASEITHSYEETQRQFAYYTFFEKQPSTGVFFQATYEVPVGAPMKLSIYDNRLHNAVLSGNTALALETMGEIYDEIKQKCFSIYEVRNAIYYISSQLISLHETISSQYDTTVVMDVHTAIDVEAMTMTLLKEKTDEILCHLTEFVLKNKHESGGNYTVVKGYILENFCNPDLDLNFLGNYFKITPSYLSRNFKSYQRQSIPDYINALRIEYAKEILGSTDLKISLISRQAGYRDITTFLRVFKKLEGTTPSEYRKSVCPLC